MSDTATAAPAANIRVNPDRLWDTLMEMAKIGPGVAGGNNRQTLTDADAEGRRLFQRWCEAEGMTMALDRMGNMFMRHEGADPDADAVYIGSHLDTQPTGGKYDGVLGVLAGLEVVRTIKDMGLKTRRPIVVTNWTNEEGTRFAPAMLASAVYAGVIDEAFANDRRDAHGLRFGDELDRIGWRGEEPVGGRPMHAMFEYHIEQGPILEAEGKQIGVVTHGQGLRWIEVTVTGKGSRTGSTPMPMRRDAGRGMARLIELVNEIAMKHQPNAVGAVGHIDVHPNSRNIIPERVVFTVDFRSHVLPPMDDLPRPRGTDCPASAALTAAAEGGAARQTRIQRRNRRRILEAALEVFAAEGYRGATIDRIAEEAGLSKPNVLYYFPSKEAIHAELLGGLLEVWLRPMQELDAEGDPLEQVLAYVRRKLVMSRDMPRESRLFAAEVFAGAPRLHAVLEGRLKLLVDRSAAIIRGWIDAGRLAPVDPVHLIFAIWSTTQHYADFEAQVRAVLEPGADPWEDADRFLQALFRRLLSV